MMNHRTTAAFGGRFALDGDDDVKLRAYDHGRDFDVLAAWVTDARTHALWCANRVPYPASSHALFALLQEEARTRGGQPYVAVDAMEQPVGFLVCAADPEARTAFLKFVLVAPEKRGMGHGTQMIRLMVRKAFEEMQMKSVKLNVFSVNAAAVRCYESVGFAVQSVQQEAFAFADERWDRWQMAVDRE